MLTSFYTPRLAITNPKKKIRRNIMMPLIYAQKDEPQIIKKIGGSPEVKKHLEDLGFNVGGQVSVVSSLGQNLIIKVKESRVAVSDELAKKIMI
jgi:ferrous iron transport protein A